MKKSVFYPLLIGSAVLSSGIVLAGAAKAEHREVASPAETLLAANEGVAVAASPVAPAKDETVYLLSNSEGQALQTFVGNNLYTGSKALPVALEVKYYLDGAEISPGALAGQSGHIKIEFRYHSLATYQGGPIPFLAATGLTLDSAKFSNLRISSGKVVSSSDTYIVVGYGLPGLNAVLGQDFFGETFVVEADTTDFELGTTYTLFSPSLLADFDVSKLSSVDGIVNSMNALEDGISEILKGTDDLSAALQTLVSQTSQLSDGVAKLSAGLNTLASNNDAIVNGATMTFDGLISQANSSLNDNLLLNLAVSLYGENYDLSLPFALTRENYNAEFEKLIAFSRAISSDVAAFISNLGSEKLPALSDYLKMLVAANPELLNEYPALANAGDVLEFVASLAPEASDTASFVEDLMTSKLIAGQASLSAYSEFYQGVLQYTGGVESVAAGLTEVANKIPALVAGEDALYHGAVKLGEGVSTFKTSGIDKLVEFANNDISSLVYGARRAVNAAASYRNFSNPTAETVKFIVKTASVK